MALARVLWGTRFRRSFSPYHMEKRQRIAEYEKRYMADYGFEAVMVAARQRLILEVLGRIRPKIVLEIG